jgi:hypothetical protein
MLPEKSGTLKALICESFLEKMGAIWAVTGLARNLQILIVRFLAVFAFRVST